jgi:hypothetical protein
MGFFQSSGILNRRGFFGGAVKAFSPSDISGLYLWLKSDDGITESNGYVTFWEEKSGNNIDPTDIIDVSVGSKNSKATVIFDGITSELTLGNVFSGFTAMSFFATWKITDVGHGGILGTDNYINFEIISLNDASQKLVRINSTPAAYGFSTDGWWDNDTWVISSMRIDNSVFGELRKNGSTSGITSDNGEIILPFSSDARNYRMGRYAVDAGSYYSNYELAEIIIYNNNIGSANVESVEKYLNTKWAVY